MTLSTMNSSLLPYNVTLDFLLESLGFSSWKTVTTSIVLPIVNFIGLVFCLLSTRIFFRPKFVDPVFFFYRLLTIVYILSLIQNIPFGVLYSPHFFATHVNTYASAVYHYWYQCVANLLFHYGDVLRICIILTRMKIFSPFVRKHFSASPQKISLFCFLACLLIDIPVAFGLSIDTFGEYVYIENKLIKNAKFYYLTSSKFGKSLVGEILVAITDLAMNILFSLIVSIVINVTFFVQYRQYLSKRHRKKLIKLGTSREDQQQQTSSNGTDNDDDENDDYQDQESLNYKVKSEHLAKTNMIHMLVTLCSISFFSRFILLVCYFHFIFYYTFSLSLTLTTIMYSIYTVIPAFSVVVFYAFNKMYREEFKNTFLWWKTNYNYAGQPDSKTGVTSRCMINL
jgi:hypothetical protein